jgi:DNA mismatch repair protein MutS
MHKIVAGVANRSYGIHVARMAGMPADVVARAADVLAGLEMRTSVSEMATDTPIVSQKATHNGRVSSPNATTKQLDLFG